MCYAFPVQVVCLIGEGLSQNVFYFSHEGTKVTKLLIIMNKKSLCPLLLCGNFLYRNYTDKNKPIKKAIALLHTIALYLLTQ